MKKTLTASMTIVAAFALSNCAPQNNLQRGVAIGTAGGALAGAIIGNNVGDNNGGRGALIGAAIGGLSGAAIGNNQDLEQGRGYTVQQQQPLQQQY